MRNTLAAIVVLGIGWLVVNVGTVRSESDPTTLPRLDEAVVRELLRSPFSSTIDKLLSQEADRLKQGGDTAALLSVLKRWYLAGSLHRTPEVIDRLAEALGRAYPEERELAARWRLEQLERSAMHSADPMNEPSILDRIPLDPEPFESMAEGFEGQGDAARHGNLWLLAGRPIEARRAFIEAFTTAQTSQHQRNAIHGIARSLRAEDRGVGRANAYVTGRLPFPDLPDPAELEEGE